MERNAEPFILLFDWLPRTGLRLIDQFVYGFLVRCAWESGGVARPQQAAVATHFKVSRHTVVRSLKRLEAASVITTTRHQSGKEYHVRAEDLQDYGDAVTSESQQS
jgi:hypothetical protein